MGKKERERAKRGIIFRDGRLLEGREAQERLLGEKMRREQKQPHVHVAVVGSQTIVVGAAKALEQAREEHPEKVVVVEPGKEPKIVNVSSFAERLKKMKDSAQ